MSAPYNNVRSKLNRAVCAYLVAQEAGGQSDVIPANSRIKSSYPNTTVQSMRGVPDPPFTGNYRITVYVRVKSSAAQDITTQNQNQAVLDHDERIANTADALMQSNDGETLRVTAQGITTAGRALAVSDPTNNADMVDFTCLQWIDQGFGSGEADPEGCAWEEILIFEALCCGANVD